MDETNFAKLINTKIHEKHSNIPRDFVIPFLFIDPVVDVFRDPCDKYSRTVTLQEKEQFVIYTEK